MLGPTITIFLGPPALAPEGTWADFQRAAERSEDAALAHSWWDAERTLFHGLLDAPSGERRPLDTLLAAVLGRAVRGATATFTLGYDRGTWLPAITIGPADVPTVTGEPVTHAELVANADRLAAALGVALARSSVGWIAAEPAR
jgi:hypothetical protein